MATQRWRGDAPAVAQQMLCMPGNVATGAVFTLSVNGKSIQFTATASTVTGVVTGLYNAWVAAQATIQEFYEVTPTDSGAAGLILKAATAGVPFVVSGAASGTSTVTLTQTVASRGPSHADDFHNWTGGTLPATGDDVYFDSGSVDCLYGLDYSGSSTDCVQTITITGTPTGGTFTLSFDGKATGPIAYNASASDVQAALEALSTVGSGNVTGGAGSLPGTPVTITFAGALGGQPVSSLAASGANLTGGTSPAVATAMTTPGVKGATLTSLTFRQSYTGKVGLPTVNAVNSQKTYTEYRGNAMRIGATTVTIGQGGIVGQGATAGAGSGRIRLDTGSVQTTLNILNSATPTDAGTKTIRWKGTHASNVVNISKGSLAAADQPGDACTIATLNVGYQSNQTADSDVLVGSGATLTNVLVSGGTVILNSDTTVYKQTGGTAALYAGAHASITVAAGTLQYQSPGTATTVGVGASGTLDAGRDMRARTFTSTTLVAGATFLDPFESVTFTNPIALSECGVEDVKLSLGKAIHVARS